VPHGDALSRRAFVVGAAALAAAGRARALESSVKSPLLDLTAGEAVRRMTRGELEAETYAAALIERCKAQAGLNAFISFDPDRVLEDARTRDAERRAGARPGPLFGLPIPVKDSVNTRDYPTTGGTAALRHFRPQADAPLVAALRAAGAIVLGKTNLHELSYGWTSNNLAFGAVHNPYDHARIPGGSSGGTAAIVAARGAPLGVAEDTEGSIRVPAAFCGIAGFRPTTGRYSTEGCVPITPLFDQIGPHARSVADLALFDSVAAGDWSALESTSLKGIRLGLVREYWFTDLDPQVRRITDAALDRLRGAGVELVEGTLPGLDRLIGLCTDQVQNHDVAAALGRYLATYHAGVGVDELIARASSDIQTTFRRYVLPGGANVVPAAAYEAARNTHLPALRALYRDYFERHGVSAIVFPATMVPPPPIGNDSEVMTSDHRRLAFDVAVARNIAPGSTAGIPGLVLPAGLTPGGLPVALEFDAPAAGDRRLLALGVALEAVLGPLPPPGDG
jgi:mandelamide amidase